MEVTQQKLDQENNSFWNELCGSGLAKSLGIHDDSPRSLKRFDDWFMDYYQYLNRYIPFDKVSGKKVLEIGLGYGTVSQKLMESGADFHSLDIGNKPVAFSKHRAYLLDKNINAQVGSALENPHPDNYFDYVISIGCLHHTGDLSKSIDEVYRVLKPGGSYVIMVYNALSYRQLRDFPVRYFKKLFNNPRSFKEKNASSKFRAKYDANGDSAAAPHTVFVKKSELNYLLRKFTNIAIKPENIGAEWFFRFMSRDKALKFGKVFGLDLYAVGIK